MGGWAGAGCFGGSGVGDGGGGGGGGEVACAAVGLETNSAVTDLNGTKQDSRGRRLDASKVNNQSNGHRDTRAAPGLVFCVGPGGIWWMKERKGRLPAAYDTCFHYSTILGKE